MERIDRQEFRVDQIDHVELFVPERRGAAAWYRSILGLEICADREHWADDPKGPLMISSDGGSTMLALFRGSPGGAEGGFRRVAFRVSGPAFLQFVDRLAGLGLTDHEGHTLTPESVTDHQQAFSIYFSDPYGHQLELTTYDTSALRAVAEPLDTTESSPLRDTPCPSESPE